MEDKYIPPRWAATYDAKHFQLNDDDVGGKPLQASTAAAPPGPGCDHDHSAEQRVYSMQTHQQLACCAHYKRLGNLYYAEGMYGRAIERYRRALIYYEYAFPNKDDEAADGAQAALDLMQVRCSSSMKSCRRTQVAD